MKRVVHRAGRFCRQGAYIFFILALSAMLLVSPYTALAVAPIPTFVACGAYANNAAAVAVALPASIASDDILLMFVETANQAVTVSNQNGGTWTQVTGTGVGTGTAAGTSATRLTVFWSRYNGTQGNPTISDSGDHQIAVMCAFRGVYNTGNPWDVTNSAIEATSDTSWSIPGNTTTVANTLVVVAGARMDDSAAAHFSAQTNADLASIAERADGGGTAGNGGGSFVMTGTKAAAGTYGATTVTNATATVKEYMTMALKPPETPAVSTGVAGNISTTAATMFGNVTSNGGGTITQHGFAYSTSNTLSTSVSTTTLGTGAVGEFSGGASGLAANTTYYYRAYATNPSDTVFGVIRSFYTGNTTVTRRIRLFGNFRIKVNNGKIYLYQN